ncbi:hypothetical protein DSO57_1035174 [Entomophthora muscae]|uniref:Uncharacterized protein n=1 Tax=Entomophthora muscae TaxID=34485 RepID=A0ACC2REC0_9FUNG|nr:hypothetical protein DSO57_1035174 [Entomophthora muscae]
MWIQVVIPIHLETASYYPAISVTNRGYNPASQSQLCLPTKKTSTGACTSTKGDTAHPLIMAIMELDPNTPLVKVRLQLGVHSIFTNKKR